MFSVIIPMYNNGDTIERALASVERQSRSDLVREVLVIDDGSQDDSFCKAKSYKETHALPIRLLGQRNAGPAAARNTGMRHAVAPYLAFLDADDEWEPDKLKLQAEALSSHPDMDLLCGGLSDGPFRIFFRRRRELCRTTLKEYCVKSFIYTSTVVIRRKRVAEAGYFDESMRYAEDMNYYQRYYRWNRVYYLPEKLASYGSSRAYYGQDGLSSHIKEMHQGRRRNFDELRRERRISAFFYLAMIFFGRLKYARRSVLVRRAAARFQKENE